MSKWKKLVLFYVLLFIAPFLIFQIDLLTKQKEQKTVVNETTSPVVYAANTQQMDVLDETSFISPSTKVLVYFTHSHESYIPIVQSKSGKQAVYHAENNIMDLGKMLSLQFQFRNMTVDILPQDNMQLMKNAGVKMVNAYTNIRPLVQNQLNKVNYDLILDIHRDSTAHGQSTAIFNDMNFAKIAFVIGAEHPNYLQNKRLAEELSNKINNIVPNLSRGVIAKSGDNVDGVYNQDLSPVSLLIEIGGIETTSEEIERTLSVLAKVVDEWRATAI